MVSMRGGAVGGAGGGGDGRLLWWGEGSRSMGVLFGCPGF